MGCVLSSPPQTTAARRVRQTFEFYDEENPPPPPPPLELKEQLYLDCNNILQGLGQIYAPDNLTPVVCLSEYAFPLFITKFSFDDQSDPIMLPIVCFSRLGAGRFVFLGAMDFMTHATLHHTETAAFIENMITWGTEYKTQTIHILVLGFSPAITATLQGDFSSYGYSVDSPKEEVPTTITASLVFIASDYPCESIGKLLIDYVRNGGTVVIFAVKVDDNTFPINRVFEESGLAFASCTLNSMSNVIPLSDLNTLSKYLLKEVSQRYVDVIKKAESKDDVQLSVLDSIVSQLRYYVAEMGPACSEQALLLVNESYSFLEKTGYDEGMNDEICPDVIHSIITVILMELLPKVAPESVKPAPKLKVFPGLTAKKLNLGNIKIRVAVKSDAWNSSGVWLPAGVVASITCDSAITAQIGSHSLCMLLKPGPWKRWPTVVNRVNISANVTTKLATPFGGIIYILTEKSKTVTAVFSNVARHPYFVQSKAQIWEQTKNNDIPWGEMQFKNICLTVPTKIMKSIRDMNAYGNTLDKLVADVNAFVGVKTSETRRVVFDVDLPKNEPVVGESVFMNVESLDGIEYIHEASSDIAQMLTYVCLNTIPCAFFDQEVELTISMLAACHAIRNSWPDEPTLAVVSGSPPKMFFDLWDLYLEKGFEPFSAAIQALLNNKDLNNAGDAWLFFIQKLGKNCDRKLRHLMDRFGQTGKLAPTSSDKLHVYQLDEGDI